MEQYIKKSDLVAEIERLKREDGNPYFPSETADKYYARGVHFTCDGLVNFLDTLEVKEADLDEETDNHWGVLSSDVRNSIYYNDYYKIAKHFFELGLSVGNKTQKGE